MLADERTGCGGVGFFLSGKGYGGQSDPEWLKICRTSVLDVPANRAVGSANGGVAY